MTDSAPTPDAGKDVCRCEKPEGVLCDGSLVCETCGCWVATTKAQRAAFYAERFARKPDAGTQREREDDRNSTERFLDGLVPIVTAYFSQRGPLWLGESAPGTIGRDPKHYESDAQEMVGEIGKEVEDLLLGYRKPAAPDAPTPEARQLRTRLIRAAASLARNKWGLCEKCGEKVESVMRDGAEALREASDALAESRPSEASQVQREGGQ